VFVQNIEIKLGSLNVETNVNIVFGIDDDLTKQFCENDDWTIMNEMWSSFSKKTGINQNDLWPLCALNERNLANAKLYPIFNLNLSKEEMSYMSRYFLIDLISSQFSTNNVIKWKQSVRLSLEELGSHVDLEKLLANRRFIFNLVNIERLIDSIIKNKPIEFNYLIKNAIRDGFAERVLNLLDEGN
jgi:hypothetical protein